MENKKLIYISLGVGVLIIILIILYMKKEKYSYAPQTNFTSTGPGNEMVMQSDGTISLTASLPIGSIIMWNSTTPPPTGWRICDGSNDTPDLQGKYIIGAQLDDGSNMLDVGKSGGSSTYQLGIANIPAHTHTVAVISSTSASVGCCSSFFAGGDNNELANSYLTDTGSNLMNYPKPISLSPPFYTMTFIMKMM